MNKNNTLVIPRLHGAEAFQFDGSFDDAEMLSRHLNGRGITSSVQIISDGIYEIEIDQRDHAETVTQGDYILLFCGGGFSVLSSEIFRQRYTTEHDYSLTDAMCWSDGDYEDIINEINERTMQPDHKFPQMFYLRIERTYSPKWMPGTITQVFSFQAPIRLIWGPERYEQIASERIKAGPRDIVIVNFSKWPQKSLQKVPMLLPFKSHEEDIYAESFRITEPVPENVSYSSSITQFIMGIRKLWS